MATLGGNICLQTRCSYTNNSEQWREGLKTCYKTEGDICHVLKQSPKCHAINNADTPLELIEAIRPDVLAKGGDYSRETVVGHESVESWGGRVHLIPLVEGLSTSRLMEKIQTHNARDASPDK